MGTVRDILEIVIAALILAVLLRVFVVETFVVEGPSMEPTLHNGQRLLVSKLSFRFAAPKAGDVIVFKYPLNPSKDYVKRIIAIGGDVVEMRMGKVYVNSERREELYVQAPGLFDMRATKVPEGFVFVMGDNRGNSEDSRFFGPVRLDALQGKALVTIWPPKSLGSVK